MGMVTIERAAWRRAPYVGTDAVRRRRLEDNVRAKFMSMNRPELAFASPRKLPKASALTGRVVVLDVAFASEASGSGFEKVTLPFITALGPRLAAWVDHHDHARHGDYAHDSRFVLATKAEHGACPEMVTPALVTRIGPVGTIVCHTDFDGLMSAAKWLRVGEEPYPLADDDARAIDTRIGAPSRTAERIDRALRARPRDAALFGLVVRHLASGLGDPSLWGAIDDAASALAPLEQAARDVARGYALLEATPPAELPSGSGTERTHRVAFVDATLAHGKYDKTSLLLLGQERAPVAVVLDQDTVTLAAAFDSGVSFLSLLGLSGGMPTLVSVQKERLADVWRLLGIAAADAPA
jgi:hypothetical protein